MPKAGVRKEGSGGEVDRIVSFCMYRSLLDAGVESAWRCWDSVFG